MSRDTTPIRRTLMHVVLATCAAVVVVMSAGSFVYELLTYRHSATQTLETTGEMIAANSTAALAFDNADDAREILSALKADRHIRAAALYRNDGTLFAAYRLSSTRGTIPEAPSAPGSRFEHGDLVSVQPVLQGARQLGSLYLDSDMDAAYDRLRLDALIATIVMALSFIVAYAVSRRLQHRISGPIVALTEVARAVSARGDYSVRAAVADGEELGVLTDTFNHMLTQIATQHGALAASELRVRAVVDSALSAVVVVDADGRIVDWNSRAERMFGWSAQEATGRLFVDTVVPERLRAMHLARVKAQLDPATVAPVGDSIETVSRRRDGQEFPIELSTSLLRNGDSISLCWFITDITSRKEAQDRIHAQLARLDLLRRITQASGERLDIPSIFRVVLARLEDQLPIAFGALCLYDTDGAILTIASIGPATLPLATAVGLKEQTQLPVDGNGLAQCLRGELVYEPDTSQVPFPFPSRLAEGGIRSLVLAPLQLESSVFGLLIAGRRPVRSFDSTDCEFLRQLSEHVALATHQARLYGALQQAYDDLRLSQHAVMQQERLRALGQMASGIAHDINNAISPVALYTESLLEREPNLSERARGYLKTIQRAIEDVASTVARMREFYRPREPQLQLARISLNRIVEQVADLTRARWRDQAQQRGVVIDFRAEHESGLPDIMGAEGEIRDALTNLVFNAVDAMPEGGTLELRTRVLESDSTRPGGSRRVAVEVSDGGVGMDEETRRRCIEPFYTTKGERGTGLGLAMVYGMVQRHSAEFEIESAVGNGTTVRLIFAEAGAGISDAATDGVTLVPARPLRVLIIDDDPLLISSLKDILDADGHSVTAETGGQSGIDSFQRATRSRTVFDLVITDLGMPYVDGRRVAAAVKAASPTTPVIMLTGWGKRLLADNDIPQHVDRVLSKPPRLSELRGAMAELTAPAVIRAQGESPP